MQRSQPLTRGSLSFTPVSTTSGPGTCTACQAATQPSPHRQRPTFRYLDRDTRFTSHTTVTAQQPDYTWRHPSTCHPAAHHHQQQSASSRSFSAKTLCKVIGKPRLQLLTIHILRWSVFLWRQKKWKRMRITTSRNTGHWRGRGKPEDWLLPKVAASCSQGRGRC